MKAGVAVLGVFLVASARHQTEQKKGPGAQDKGYRFSADVPLIPMPQTEMKFERVAATGESTLIKSVGLVRRPTEPEPGCFELLLQAHWAGVPPGPGLLQVSITDTLAKKTAQSSVAFSLVP